MPKETHATEGIILIRHFPAPLGFLGIWASPGTLKGPRDEITRGKLWLANLRVGTTH